ncbi:MAG: hypothetical protein HYU68_00475 [Bacteroidetes bacterium]|nr:hypothetical protein [Bacteroidota bacterium]
MITTSHSAVAPIDYISTSNEFIFLKDDYILRVNFEAKTFQLNMPDRIAYDENFEFIQSPPAWFEDKIDYYIIEWAQNAIKWNDQTIRNSRHIVKTSVEVDEIVYHVEFNTKTNDLSIEIPGKTIISHPNSLFYDFPEFQFMDNGELITLLTAEIYYQAQGLDLKPSRRKFYAPISFQPKKITTSRNKYKFEYKLENDLIFLEIPTRQLHTNMLTIELSSTELTKMHDGKLIDVIRNVVHEQSLSV